MAQRRRKCCELLWVRQIFLWWSPTQICPETTDRSNCTKTEAHRNNIGHNLQPSSIMVHGKVSLYRPQPASELVGNQGWSCQSWVECHRMQHSRAWQLLPHTAVTTASITATTPPDWLRDTVPYPSLMCSVIQLATQLLCHLQII